MSALRWLIQQSAVLCLSWLSAAGWLALVFSVFDVDNDLVWIVGVVASAILPLVSFLESLLMLVLRKKNKMRFLDNVFTAAVLAVAPLVGGYLYMIGECVECKPALASLLFVTLVFAVPAAAFQSSIRRLIIAI